MRKFLITISTLLSVFLIIPQQSYAAALALDPTFNSAGTGFGGGLAKEPVITDNGTKYMFVGTFTSYNGTTANRIVKINMDGSLDTAFMTNVGTGFATQTTGMGVQSDGKIVISGFPSQIYNGTSLSGGITRLNADGTLDTAFKTAVGTSTPGGLLGMEVLSNDKILLLGSASFTSFNGAPASRIFLLNADGTPDTAFNANLATGIWIQAGLSQLNVATHLSDGKILVSGNGSGRSTLLRLNADGTLDNTFNPSGVGTNIGVWDHKVLSNNKIVVVGQFTTYNNISTPRIMLLDYDGNLDSSFIVGTGIAANTPTGVIDVPSGAFIVAGPSTDFNSIPFPFYLAINQDGSAPALDFGTGFNNVGSTDPGIINNDGKLMLVGSFTTYNGSTVSTGIIRFNQDFTPPTLSNINLASNHTNTSYAGEGHVVTLSFVSSDVVTGSTITIDGQSVTPSCSGTAPTVSCTATRSITSSIPAVDGLITFSLSVSSEGGTSATISTTSDSSSVTIDRVAPSPITISSPTNHSTVGPSIFPVTGTCESGVLVLINVTNGTPSSQTVSCSGGVYSTNPIITTGSPTVTASQTDLAGNSSAIFSSYTRSSGGPTVTIQSPTTSTNPFGTTTVSGTCDTGITVSLSGTNFSPTTTTCTSGSYSASINVTGQLLLTVSQTDGVGNVGSAQFAAVAPGAVMLLPSMSVTPVPTTPPVITIPIVTPTIPASTTKTFISPIDGTTKDCPAFTSYLKNKDKKNSVDEVKILQAFLNKYQNEKIPLTGYFGSQTLAAVKRFQLAYKSEILTPWKLTKPTGHVYRSTRTKMSQLIGCTEGSVTLHSGTTISSN